MRRLLTLGALAEAEFYMRVEHERIARVQFADASLRHLCSLTARIRATVRPRDAPMQCPFFAPDRVFAVVIFEHGKSGG